MDSLSESISIDFIGTSHIKFYAVNCLSFMEYPGFYSGLLLFALIGALKEKRYNDKP
jgi:hypothetical protein